MSSTNANSRLGYGLNSRNKRKKGLAGFGGDDDSDSDGSDGGGRGPADTTNGRNAINREIAAEQAALRKRAQVAMRSSAVDSAVYDYDGEYDSFASGKEKAAATSTTASKKGEKVQSRYITNLLKTAEKRNQEQEIVYERKVVKEQAQEDPEFEGKEKFITSSYRRKLAEREEWAKQEEERTKKEEEQDVTKTAKGGNFLYGGFGRNVVMGVGGDKKVNETDNSKQINDGNKEGIVGENEYQQRDSSRETERRGSSKRSRDARDTHSNQPPPLSGEKDNVTSSMTDAPLSGEIPIGIKGTTTKKDDESHITVKTRSQILSERAMKLREARERYFKRMGNSSSSQ